MPPADTSAGPVAPAAASRAAERDRRGILAELWQHRQGFFVVFVLTFAGTITLYNYTNYMTPFLINTVGLDRQDANDIRILADFAYMIFLIGLGALSDRVGRKPIHLYMAIGSTVATVPLMSLLKAWPSYTLGLVISIIGVSFVAGYSSIGGILKAEQFPPHVRALGTGLPYALAVSLFGGTVTPIALGLKEAGHESLFFYYVSLCALIGVIYCIWRVPETRGKDMRAAEPDRAERDVTPSDR